MADISKIQIESGVFNIKDETARQQIQALTDYRKKVLIFGDSWSMNNYPYISSQDNMWYNLYAKKLDLDVTSYAISGAGYIVENNTILSQVSTASNNEDPDDIAKIIVYGGLNDMGRLSSGTTLYTPCTQVVNALKSAFPDSEIIIAGVNLYDGGLFPNMDLVKNSLQDAAYTGGCRFVDTIPFLQGYPSLFDNSTHHPNEAGQIFLSGAMASAIEGTYKKAPVTIASPYSFTKSASWLPDLSVELLYLDEFICMKITTTIADAFGADGYQGVYTCNYFDFNRHTYSSLVLVDSSQPGQKTCNIVTRTSANQIGIFYPGSVTGTFTGYIYIPY